MNEVIIKGGHRQDAAFLRSSKDWTQMVAVMPLMMSVLA